MNIIILGAGQVGSTLAENLIREDNDITVVDTDGDRLHTLQNRLDIRTVTGFASHPHILRRAGLDSADMLIAVTSNDETNIVACQIAHTLFRTPTKIARIRSGRYLLHEELFSNDAIPVDVCISPERLITRNIQRLIEHPAALQVLDFADGQVRLIAIRPHYGDSMVGQTLQAVRSSLTDIDVRIAAIYRGDHTIPISSQTEIQANDIVFLLSASKDVTPLMQTLGKREQYRNIMIAGGGNIGRRLALALEKQYDVKVIEHNPNNTQRLTEELHNTMILAADACDRELLLDENIQKVDVFIALTNDDEVNIMSAIQAKKLGARKVIALINRTAYVQLIEGGVIDIVISPQQITIGSILTHLRHGDVSNVYSLRRGAAEAIELVAHGTKKTSKVIGRRLADIKLPPNTTLGAIVRAGEVIIAEKDTVIQPDDHVILFVTDKKYVKDVERLFQVNLAFF